MFVYIAHPLRVQSPPEISGSRTLESLPEGAPEGFRNAQQVYMNGNNNIFRMVLPADLTEVFTMSGKMK